MEGPFHVVYFCGSAKLCGRAAGPSRGPVAEKNALARPPAVLVFWRRPALPQPCQQAGRPLFLDRSLTLRLGLGIWPRGTTPPAGSRLLECLYVVRLRAGRSQRPTDRRAALPLPVLLSFEFVLRLTRHHNVVHEVWPFSWDMLQLVQASGARSRRAELALYYNVVQEGRGLQPAHFNTYPIEGRRRFRVLPMNRP